MASKYTSSNYCFCLVSRMRYVQFQLRPLHHSSLAYAISYVVITSITSFHLPYVFVSYPDSELEDFHEAGGAYKYFPKTLQRPYFQELLNRTYYKEPGKIRVARTWECHDGISLSLSLLLIKLCTFVTNSFSFL